MIKLDIAKCYPFASKDEIASLKNNAQESLDLLYTARGKGNDFLGWVNLPDQITDSQIAAISEAARSLTDRADMIIVIGIGGSYLGAKAVAEAMTGSFAMLDRNNRSPRIVFAGENLSEQYMGELLEVSKQYSIATIVISKSGTTTEPAVAFRLVKAEIEARYGREEAQKRIMAVTDAARGALKKLSTDENYRTFVIPDNVGGRYSVLTPVGLLPLAAAGVNIAELVRGARDMAAATSREVPFDKNIAAQYAAARNALYRKGYKIEILASYEPRLQYFAEWWKQLYGESEGKDGKGIFPASVTLTADLHSMGQYIQQGERHLFETVISVAEPQKRVEIESDAQDLDGLNFLSGKRLDEVNKMAELGVRIAHVDGGVPNIRIEIPQINEYYIGALIYFFEKACGISGYILGVNPFDQPGVEAYKKNMFALLDKPGYEAESRAIREKLKE